MSLRFGPTKIAVVTKQILITATSNIKKYSKYLSLPNQRTVKARMPTIKGYHEAMASPKSTSIPKVAPPRLPAS